VKDQIEKGRREKTGSSRKMYKDMYERCDKNIKKFKKERDQNSQKRRLLRLTNKPCKASWHKVT
jgi:hypothetical protein